MNQLIKIKDYEYFFKKIYSKITVNIIFRLEK